MATEPGLWEVWGIASLTQRRFVADGVYISDLKTVVSINGEYSKRNFTVFDIQSLKGSRQLTKTLPFLPEEAAAAEEASIETLNVRYNPERPELAADIQKALPNTFTRSKVIQFLHRNA